MDDDVLGDIPTLNVDMPEIPITHEQPRTTLESLEQIRKEFTKKLSDAGTDSGKKRRYQRQLKQFEDAIKATKENKSFNYSELIVPPGFAQIPLRQDGHAIGLSSSNSRLAPVPPTAASAASSKQSPSRESSRASSTSNLNATASGAAASASAVDAENDASDDVMAQLNRELDCAGADNDDDDEDVVVDPEMAHFDKMINTALPKISKMIPKELTIKNDELDNFDEEEANSMFNVPQSGAVSRKQPKQQQAAAASASSRQSQAASGNRTSATPSLARTSLNANSRPQSQNKELDLLLERQRMFKEAALRAKQEGDTKVALVYLRHSKGFDSMILAAENGLPLDMKNLPVPPQLMESATGGANQNQRISVASSLSPTSQVTNRFSSVLTLKTPESLVDINAPIAGDRKTIFKRLQEDLVEQVGIATANFKHFTSMGDVSNATKFNQIARESVQDLESLKGAYQLGQEVPLYHYERRTYQTIDCNSDLTDNDLELSVVRAVNLPLPAGFETKHMTTYVKYEFPYPPEAAQTDKTNKQSGTLNPEYNQNFKIQIQRKQPKFVRLMNRKELKCEIYYRAGLLKGDKLLASCTVKLQPLETSSTIHDAFDLLEGRRQIGGKLELKIRIREPLIHKEVKVLEHKWLIIDKFNVQKKSVISL